MDVSHKSGTSNASHLLTLAIHKQVLVCCSWSYSTTSKVFPKLAVFIDHLDVIVTAQISKTSLFQKDDMVQSFGHFRQPLKLIFNSPAIFKWPEYLSTYSKFMSHFYTPWKYQETSYFFMFSRGIEIKCWLEMGCDFIIVSFMIFFIFQNISVLATEVIWCHRNLNSRNETWRWILGH